MDDLVRISIALRALLADMKSHQKDLDGRIDGRSLAIAITNTETALLWLEHSMGF